MSNKTIQIAIDGPASSGKSTIANKLSKKVGFKYLDTGSMYRAVTLFFNEHNLDIDKMTELDIDNTLKLIQIKISFRENSNDIFLNEKNVSKLIRTDEINSNIGKISSSRQVRNFLINSQREIAKDQNIIMDGRDIGTNVLLNADIKIFLTASPETRAERRYKENIDNNFSNKSIQEIKLDIIKRDKNDTERKIDPLIQSEDAIVIDTSFLTIDDVVNKIIKLIEK